MTILYISKGVRDPNVEKTLQGEVPPPARMISFYELFTPKRGFVHGSGRAKLFDRWVELREQYPDDAYLMIDSGSFEFFNMSGKKKLSVSTTQDHFFQEYVRFLIENQNKIDGYIVFDDITDEMKTLRYQIQMQRCGLSPIPVFHFNEPMALLEFYYRQFDYIAIGNVARASQGGMAVVRRFLHNCFALKERVEYEEGKKIKTHGLGILNPVMLGEFPFDSADSGSGIDYAVHGKIRTTKGRSVKISSHRKDVEHTILFEDMPKKEQQDILEELKAMNIPFEEISRPDNIGNQVRLSHYVKALYHMRKEIDRIREEVESSDEGYYFQSSLFGF